MINTDRIVPVMATDLLTLLSEVFAIASVSVTPLQAKAIAEFEVTTAESGAQLCAEPVKSLNFASGVTSATVYFIPALDYEGFTVNGAAATMAGADVVADGSSLYSATLATGTVTIAKVGA